MIITLEKVSNARKEGNFGKIDIEYRRDGGKTTSRTLVAIGGTKDIINLFREDGAVGQDYEVELEKVEKGDKTFYNWVSAKKVEKGSGAKAAGGGYQAKGTWETHEERAKKQVYIARQNALTNAVAFLSAKDGKATPDDVISLAEHFTAFTLGDIDITLPDAPPGEAKAATTKSDAKKTDDADFDDDIPF